LRQWRTVVNAAMNIRFQKCGQFLACLRTCWLLQKHCSVSHCVNRTVQTVRRQKAVLYRTDSSPFCYRIYSSVPSVNISLCSPLFSFSQHSAFQSALFLHSTFRSPVRSVPSVNIPFSSPLCSSSQHSALQSALFLQSTFCSPDRSVPSVNIPLSSPLCSFIQHSAFQSALFLQSTFRFQVRSVPSFNIPLSSPLCSFIQHSALQSALFLQSTVRSVPSVNIPLSSSLCSFSQHSALQSALLRHIKQITLSVSRSYKHRPSSLHQTPTVTSPAFHCEGLRSTPSRFMYEPWCSNSSTNCLQ